MKFMHASSLIAAVLSLGTVHAFAQAAAGPPSTSPVQIQSTAQGQTPSAASPPCRSVPYQPVGNTKTFYLSGAIDMSEMNELLTTLRNILNPDVKITLMPSQRAIVMRTATPEQVELAEKIINELDRPRRTYRISYTSTERDGSKTIGVQHYNLVAVSAQ